jgi:hypothetical protein
MSINSATTSSLLPGLEKDVFDAMDWERWLLILEGYGVGPIMVWLIRNFWWDATMVCCALGNYRGLFCAGRGVTQGGALSAKLFNILVDEGVAPPTL